MHQKDEGFAAPLVLILVLALLAVPAYYWFTLNQEEYMHDDDVHGASAVGRLSNEPGFGVSVISSSPTWDLMEYLCETLDECLASLNSGRRLGTVSGGKTDLHEVVVEYSTEWSNYPYVKYFVRPGWGSSGRMFKVSSTGDIPGSDVYQVNEGGDVYEVMVAPTETLKDSFYESATFKD